MTRTPGSRRQLLTPVKTEAVLHFFTGPTRKLQTKHRTQASKETKAKAGLITLHISKRYKMSLKSKFSSVITLGFAVAAFAVVGLAQDTKVQDDNEQKMERKHGRGGHRGMRGKGDGMRGMRGGFGLRGIELTDAQKDQIRQIHEANKPSESLRAEFKAMREARRNGEQITPEQREKFKALRQEMRAKHDAVRAQILAILTPEQRQQLEARKAEREKRREEFRQNRQERKSLRNTAKPTDDN
jgi:periplasmic protein CpxP/Spy